MDPRSKEFIWAAKLSGEKKLVKWGGKSDGTLEQLCLKMAVLGPGAKNNERNIVEVTTFDSEQAKIKTCICALGIGKSENQTLADVALYPPAHFTLVEGSGPVHIVANHTVLDEDDFSDDDDMSDYEEEMADVSPKKINGKGDAPKQKKSKAKAAEEDEDLDDDSELDDDDDLVSDDDFLDMEAAEDDDEEEEEEEVQEVAPKKRKLSNGKSKVEKKAEAAAKTSPVKKTIKSERQTPKAQKTESVGPKTPKNEKGLKTPKSEKKTPSKFKFTSVEEVKAAIKKLPGGKPRKQDKFANWIENTFKVSEDSWKNDLWMWHKKEQGL